LKIEILKIIDDVKQKKELSENFTAEDIYKISKKAASTFLSVLPEDEISTCILNAIWKALEKYDFQSRVDVNLLPICTRGSLWSVYLERNSIVKIRHLGYMKILYQKTTKILTQLTCWKR